MIPTPLFAKLELPPDCRWEYYCESTRVDRHDVSLVVNGVEVMNNTMNTPTMSSDVYEVLCFYFVDREEFWILEHHHDDATQDERLSRTEAMDWLRRRGAMASTALH